MTDYIVGFIVGAITGAVIHWVNVRGEIAKLREALNRFAGISLVYPLDPQQLALDILNARKVLNERKNER